MNGFRTLASLVLALLCTAPSRADFAGPSIARHAVSPDGNLIVRIVTREDEATPDKRKTEACYYEYDDKTNGYELRTSFPLTGYYAQLLYLSDAGDLALIALGEKQSITVYSREGKLRKTWDLDDFLTPAEIEACAQTGSTLQWLDEAGFYDRTFAFRGPSRQIRALRGSFAVMRGMNDKVRFGASINTETLVLEKHEPE